MTGRPPLQAVSIATSLWAVACRWWTSCIARSADAGSLFQAQIPLPVESVVSCCPDVMLS